MSRHVRMVNRYEAAWVHPDSWEVQPGRSEVCLLLAVLGQAKADFQLLSKRGRICNGQCVGKSARMSGMLQDYRKNAAIRDLCQFFQGDDARIVRALQRVDERVPDVKEYRRALAQPTGL